MQICTRLVMDYAHYLTLSALQKQLLYPIVITGAEVDDKEKRNIFEQYCKSWTKESNFMIFNSGLNILKETWALRDKQLAAREAPTATWANITAGRDSRFQYMLG
jgi:hypothetical protein